MMQERKVVELDKIKKVKTNKIKNNQHKLILVIFIIILIISFMITVYFSLRKNQTLFSDFCSDFSNSFLIEKACHLNEDEIMINLKRSSDEISLKKINFEFQPSNSLWKVDGSKCLDIRLRGNKYSDYCNIIKEEEQLDYIFNLSLGYQDEVFITVEGEGYECGIGKISINKEC